MMKRVVLLLMVLGVAAPLTGCITYPPEPTGKEVWINGHYTRVGEWLPGHWQ
jgi:hypothetical protein